VEALGLDDGISDEFTLFNIKGDGDDDDAIVGDVVAIPENFFGNTGGSAVVHEHTAEGHGVLDDIGRGVVQDEGVAIAEGEDAVVGIAHV